MRARRRSLIALAFTLWWVAAPARAATGDWPGYLFGLRHSSMNAAATAITPLDVPGLAPDWTFTSDPPTLPDQPVAAFVASPTVFEGHVFIGSNTGTFYALDETDGSVSWSADLGYTPSITCSTPRGITSTATVAFDTTRGENVVYVAGGHGDLFALAADDGALVWQSPVVDPGSTENAGYNWASPIVVAGHVFMGVSSQCDKPLVRGGLKQFDQATGALQHSYWTVPKGSIGGSVWTSPASKGQNVWVTTGNAHTGDLPGDSFAVVRLSVSALAKQGRWVLGVGRDLDWGGSPTLFSATVGGSPRTMVGACNKNGRYYALVAAALAKGPVWSRRLGASAQAGTGASCLAAAIWDDPDGLLITASNQTTIDGVTFPGSLRALDPNDGSSTWETPLPDGPVIGSPAMNGSGLIAAGTYDSRDPATNAVYLVDASDGTVLRTIVTTAPVFSQPVFAGGHLFVAGTDGVLTAYAPA